MVYMEFTKEQLTSLEIILDYLAFNNEEMKNYFQTPVDERDGHIYSHIKDISKVLDMSYDDYEAEYKDDTEKNDTKVIITDLNNKLVAIEISDGQDIPSARVLERYSDSCYETNACDGCKADKSGKQCCN